MYIYIYGYSQVTAKCLPLSNTASFENPLVNPVYYRRKHRYIYGMGVCPDSSDRGQVGNTDRDEGRGLRCQVPYCHK